MPASDPSTRSICILRLSALGDVTHVLPVIQALRQQRPEAKLAWIIGRFEQQLVQGIEGVEFIPFDKKEGWKAFAKIRNNLARRRFATLLHMQVSARANLASLCVKAEDRIGWDRARSRDFHHWFVDRAVTSVALQHQVEAFLGFCEALGLQPAPPRWHLPVSDEARAWARQVLDGSRPAVVISPCSSHALRNWRPEHYARVADYIRGELHGHVVLSGGPSALERDMGQVIERSMTEVCTNLIGRDTLEQSKALLEAADLLISPDSGPVHIASALGTPVLGLYAATWSLRSGPYRSLPLCVDRFAEAARRYRGKEPEELRWGTRIEVPGVMDLVQPEDVIAQLDAWWREHAAQGNSPA